LGFDLIWYGSALHDHLQIAYMTPPFGYNLFLMRAMAPQGDQLRDIYGSDSRSSRDAARAGDRHALPANRALA
jgi:hypothetical protein